MPHFLKKCKFPTFGAKKYKIVHFEFPIQKCLNISDFLTLKENIIGYMFKIRILKQGRAIINSSLSREIWIYIVGYLLGEFQLIFSIKLSWLKFKRGCSGDAVAETAHIRYQMKALTARTFLNGDAQLIKGVHL